MVIILSLMNINSDFKNSEKGQVMVEFAIVIPIFLLILFFLMDLGWIMYQKVMLDYTCRQIAWDLDLGEDETWVMRNMRPIVYKNNSANKLLKKQFDKNNQGTYIDINSISISDGKIGVYPGRKNYRYKGGGFSADVNYKTTTLEIQGKIKYKIEPLTPIAKSFFRNGIILTNKLYKARRGVMQTS